LSDGSRGIADEQFMVVLLDLDALPGDAAAAEDAVAVEADDAGAADGAEDRVCAVDELGQRVRAGPRAGPPACDGRAVAEGFVGAKGVVDAAPGSAVDLEVSGAIASGVEVDELAHAGAVEPFDLALGLGMIRSSVAGRDAETDELGVEGADAGGTRGAHGVEGVVGEDLLGEPDVAEDVPQHVPGTVHGDVGAGLVGQAVARVVVDDRQRHELAAVDFDGAFEVELPQRVGRRALEARGGPGRRSIFDGNAVVTAQDVGDGADGRHRLGGQITSPPEQEEVNLAWPPVEAVAHAKDLLLHVVGSACGGCMRPARAIDEGRIGLGVMTRQPLVGDASADAELPGRRGDGEVEMTNGMDECETDFVHG